MARADNHEIHVRIFKHFIGARDCLSKPKTFTDVVCRNSGRGGDRSKLRAFRLEMRQQHRGNITARSDDTQPNRFLGAMNWRREFYATRDLAIGIVIEQDAKIRFACVSRYQFVRAFRVFDPEAMRCKSLDVNAFVTDELEKALDVSFLSPANIWKRIVMSAFFVIGIVAPWSIRHGNNQL